MTENNRKKEKKTDFELDWIYGQYEEGASVSDIAKELGKSEAYVYAHMKKRPEEYEDVKRILEEKLNLRRRRIRGLSDKMTLEYMEEMSEKKDREPAEMDRVSRIGKDYDHRILLDEGKNTENIGVGGMPFEVTFVKNYEGTAPETDDDVTGDRCESDD